MEATKLTGTVYYINSDVMFLEFFDPKQNVFEYYLKEYERNDFEYQFGVTEPFTVKQLTQLYDQGYFN
ncbi:MAG: hypothetical protein J6S67_24520 [Methanobrevibacter sp.]|nr:hypothetical protein [Methanobrevibacter sp.]